MVRHSSFMSLAAALLLVLCASFACVPTHAATLFLASTGVAPLSSFAQLATICKGVNAKATVVVTDTQSTKDAVKQLLAPTEYENVYVSATYSVPDATYHWVIENPDGTTTYKLVDVNDYVNHKEPDNQLFYVAYGLNPDMAGLYPQDGTANFPVVCTTDDPTYTTTTTTTTTTSTASPSGPGTTTPPTSSPGNGGDGDKKKSGGFPWWGILILVLGIVAILVVVIVVVCCCCFECVPAEDDDDDEEENDDTVASPRADSTRDTRSFSGSSRGSSHSSKPNSTYGEGSVSRSGSRSSSRHRSSHRGSRSHSRSSSAFTDTYSRSSDASVSPSDESNSR